MNTFGGWFDIFSQGTLRGYVGMSQKGLTERSRRAQHVMGVGARSDAEDRRHDFGPQHT